VMGLGANKKYKDSVFRKLFNNKKMLIQLYNAVEGTNYPNDTDITINTIEAVLYNGWKNDISFIIDGMLIVLIEHQSTINKNMPLRFLLYLVMLYEKLIDSKALYKKGLIKIPKPVFIVLYNGKEEYPEESILKLSDAFISDGKDFTLDLQVKVININYGKSQGILDKSRELKDYSYLVYLVNGYLAEGKSLEEAIKLAVNDCINQDRLKNFLQSHRSEVVDMMATEWKLTDALEVRYEEGIEEGIEKGERMGIEKGEQIGVAKTAKRLLYRGYAIPEIIDVTGLTEAEIKKLL
jgi:predicted transposase/invertase (TIGR01784 family)